MPRPLIRPRPIGRVAIAGTSMAPTLQPGDFCLIVPARRVRVGDVLVVRRPDRPDLLVVKRAVRAHADGWWLAGDNPAASDDSRLFGPVPAGAPLARVVWRYWPLARFGSL